MTKQVSALFVFLFFWLTAFALYFNTAGAGFVTDEIGWLQTYKATGWHGIFTAFGDKSLHFVYHLVGFSFWKIFGLNGFAWMVVFVTLHAGIALLSFLVFKELLTKENISSGALIAFAGSLLFVVSPYQTEPLVWYACIHYLVCSFLLLLSFCFLLLYLRKQQQKFIAAFYLTYIVAVFTLEISFAFPVILLLFFAFWPSKIFVGASRIRLIKILVLPSFGLLLFYFLLSKILRGSIVGHYGAAQHLNFSIPLLMSNLSKYCAKIFLLTQFIPYEKRILLYQLFEKRKFVYALFFAITATGICFTFLHRKLKKEFRISILLFAFFVIALLPILNLFFSSIVNIEGDRFTYFASVFAYHFFVLASIALFRKCGWALIIVFLFFNVKFLQFNTESWSHSKFIQQSLLKNFRWQQAEKIYLLNVPDNFRGAYMFRSFAPDNSFAETLALRTGENVEDKTTEILEYNMTTVADSVSVEKISDTTLKITFAQWGNWWWQNGKGTNNFSDNQYETTTDGWSHSYTIQFHQKISNAVYLYQCGGEWREVKDF